MNPSLLASIALCALTVSLLATPLARAEFPDPLPKAILLWPSGAPGSESRQHEPEHREGDNITNVHAPSITPFLPDADQATGTAVIICPGGGHAKLCLGHEGYSLGEWMRDHGIAAFVLKYRLSKEPDSPYTLEDHAMADARRAIRTVRSRAAEWHLNPERIGIIGFSAGGELAAYSAMESDLGKVDSLDPVERASCRPDFQGLIYPGKSSTFSAKAGMPPVFIACGYGDRPDISEGMASVYLQYKAAGVKAELHIFANAKHGFGYRKSAASTSAASRWPDRFYEWLVDSQLLDDKSQTTPKE